MKVISFTFPIFLAGQSDLKSDLSLQFDQFTLSKNDFNDRSDTGNVNLIKQMLEFYLQIAGRDSKFAGLMLNSGCWCQLLNQRVKGKGDPVDEFDG